MIRYAGVGLLALVAFACGSALGPVRANASGGVSVSVAQVSNGAKSFEQNCSACHGAHLEGGVGPALTGPNFKTLSTKVHATVSDVFTYMRQSMPMNAPGTLKRDQYLSIMAYVLSKNGVKPGSTPLTYTAASTSAAPVVKL